MPLHWPSCNGGSTFSPAVFPLLRVGIKATLNHLMLTCVRWLQILYDCTIVPLSHRYVAVQRLNYFTPESTIRGTGFHEDGHSTGGDSCDGDGGGGGSGRNAFGSASDSDGSTTIVSRRARRLSVEAKDDAGETTNNAALEVALVDGGSALPSGHAGTAAAAAAAGQALPAAAAAGAEGDGGLASLFASSVGGAVSPSTLREVLAIQHQALGALLGLGAAIGAQQQHYQPAHASVAMQPAPPSKQPGDGRTHHTDYHSHHHPSTADVLPFPGSSGRVDVSGGEAGAAERLSPRLRTRPSVRSDDAPLGNQKGNAWGDGGDDGVQDERLPLPSQPLLQPSAAATILKVPSTSATTTDGTATATTTTTSSSATTPPYTPPVGGATHPLHPAPPAHKEGDPSQHYDYHHHHHPSMVPANVQQPGTGLFKLEPRLPGGSNAIKISSSSSTNSTSNPISLLKFDFRKIPPTQAVHVTGRADVAAKRYHGPVPSPLMHDQSTHIAHAVLPLLRFGQIDVPPPPAGSGTKFATSPPPQITAGQANSVHHSKPHSNPQSQAHSRQQQYPAALQPTATISSRYPQSYPNEQYSQHHSQGHGKYRFLPLASVLPPQDKKPSFPLLRLCDPAPLTSKDASTANNQHQHSHAKARVLGTHNDPRIFPGPAGLNASRQKMQRTVDTNLILTSDEEDDLDSTRHTDADADAGEDAASLNRLPFRLPASIKPDTCAHAGEAGATKKTLSVDRGTSPIATLVPFNAVERLEAERELELMHALDDLDAQVESALLRRRRPTTPRNRYDATEGASIVNRAAEHRSVVNRVLAEARSYREVGRFSSPAPTTASAFASAAANSQHAAPAALYGMHSDEADAILAAAEAPSASLFKETNVTHTEARAAAGPGPELARLRDEWLRVEKLRHAQAPKDIQEQLDAMVPSSKQPGYHDWRTSAAPPEQPAQPLPYTNRSLDGAGFTSPSATLPQHAIGDVAGRRSQSPAHASTPQQLQQHHQHQRQHRYDRCRQETGQTTGSASPSVRQQQQHRYRHHRGSSGIGERNSGDGREGRSGDGSVAGSFAFPNVRRQHDSGKHPLSHSVSSGGSFGGSFGGNFHHVLDLEMDPRDSVFMSDSDYSDDDSKRCHGDGANSSSFPGGSSISGVVDGGAGAGAGAGSGSGSGGGGGDGAAAGSRSQPLQSPLRSTFGTPSLYTIVDGSLQNLDDARADDNDAEANGQIQCVTVDDLPFPEQPNASLQRPSAPAYVSGVGGASASADGGYADANDVSGTSILGADLVLESIRKQLGVASAQLQSAEDADAALEAEMRDLSGLTSMTGNESYGGGAGGTAADQTMAFEGLSYLGNI